ncbi:dehydrin DHN1-like [Impatiens glandulifera]|uniref:dehydrin DHN1-like n=1 Tax=Impatiens glandulifera TaxID=253017 RepID=UPI001FB14BCB|nr:dehydrin DHN1-like [Impatiens glandulifera]
MAQFGTKYGRQTDDAGNPICSPQTEECGIPVRQTTDQCGNPLKHEHVGTGTTWEYEMPGGSLGDYLSGTGTRIGGDGRGLVGKHKQQPDFHGAAGVIFFRSGSSSSEDDGVGGRKKKEKIKEKLPGGHKEDQHEKKEIMDG